MSQKNTEEYVPRDYQVEFKPNAMGERDSDSCSNFTTSSDFTSIEIPPTANTDSPAPPSGLSQPRIIRTANETRSIYISRSRFFIRLFSTSASVGIVAGIASAYAPYFDTKDSRLIYDGRDLWPEYIDMRPSNLMLAVGAITSFFSGGLLIAGLFPNVRHVTRIGDLLALIVASIVLPLAVFSTSYFCWYKTSHQTFWSWTCDHTQVDHPEVQFKMICGEVKFAFAMGWAVATAESLMLINVFLGCILVKRKVRIIEIKLGRLVIPGIGEGSGYKS